MGRMANACTDPEAKKRNDEYLKTRVPKDTSAEN
ncbi:hypothetical protein PI124_g3696 [Phytophthora idaei]|nr:hypothetical protein PI125_g3178 [Phytophthora idaei]KAG3171528.1 hypothetical protein PI126_g1815 [Phytophthora idaei]KAG3251669.1 hypothetical protein PI124_g3696 [Phytophthora idaei]